MKTIHAAGVRTNIKNYGNRPETDPAIVHVQRADRKVSTDYNAVIYPNGYVKEVPSLDDARRLAYTIYQKNGGSAPRNLNQLRKHAEHCAKR